MLRSIKDLEKKKAETKDGAKCSIVTFLFAESDRKIEYLVVDTGSILPGKHVVVRPEEEILSIGSGNKLQLNMGIDELEQATDASRHRPISEEKVNRFLRSSLPNTLWYPAGVEPSLSIQYQNYELLKGRDIEEGEGNIEERLRSTKHLEGYSIRAKDGTIGELKDIVMDTSDWKIRYFVIDTRVLLPGKKVMVSPDWVKDIDWEETEIVVDHTIEEIKHSPEYDPADPVNREYEEVLYDYYGRPYYWERTDH